MIRVLSTESVDKFVLVTVQHDGLANVADLRAAAINAALDAEKKFDLSSERASGRGAVITFSWTALDSAAPSV